MKHLKHLFIAAVFAAGLSSVAQAGEYEAEHIKSTTQMRGMDTDTHTFIHYSKTSNPKLRFLNGKPSKRQIEDSNTYGNQLYYVVPVSVHTDERYENNGWEVQRHYTIVNFGFKGTATLSTATYPQFWQTITVSSYAFSVSGTNTVTVATTRQEFRNLTSTLKYRYEYIPMNEYKFVHIDKRQSVLAEVLGNSYSIEGHSVESVKLARCLVHTEGGGNPKRGVWEYVKHHRQIANAVFNGAGYHSPYHSGTINGFCRWLNENYNDNSQLPERGEALLSDYIASLRPVDEPRGNDEDES